MTATEYEGVVDSLATPIRDLADGKPYFVFGMSNPKVRPPGSPLGTAVFYVNLEDEYARDIVAMITKAYELGVTAQIKETQMIVQWVQLPRRSPPAPAHP